MQLLDFSNIDRRSVNRSPLGFAFALQKGSPAEKFSYLFSRGEYKAAEALRSFVGPVLWFEALFAWGRFDEAEGLLRGSAGRFQIIPGYVLRLCCSDSVDPALVIAAQEFVRSFARDRLPYPFQYQDGLLKPLRLGESIHQGHRSEDRLVADLAWAISPTAARVLVYSNSFEHRLCRAMRKGRSVELSTLELFNGRVARPLLAEALFSVGAVKAFETVIQKFPACIEYLNALETYIDHIPSQVAGLQSHVRILLARQAAMSALKELV